jgi:hypothetical protein
MGTLQHLIAQLNELNALRDRIREVELSACHPRQSFEFLMLDGAATKTRRLNS